MQDHLSSSSEEEWDESESELETVSQEQHPQVKAFVKWIVALIVAFQAAFVIPYNATQWLFTFITMVFTTLQTVCPTPFIAAVVALPGSLYLAWTQ